ncbi:response regulator receiver domain protein, partial [Striga asiatica]
MEKSRFLIHRENPQTNEGIPPAKLLLLKSSDSKFTAFSKNHGSTLPEKVAGSSPNAVITPFKRLQLRSMTCSWFRRWKNWAGSGPESPLLDRLSWVRPVRLVIEGDILPERPLEGSHRPVTLPESLQTIPSHSQQSSGGAHGRGVEEEEEEDERLRLNWTSEPRSRELHAPWQ